MAFHDKTKNGPMKQYTVVTITSAEAYADNPSIHDDKVSAFNKEHDVFFNQIVPTIRLDNGRILVSTVCLYADGAK